MKNFLLAGLIFLKTGLLFLFSISLSAQPTIEWQKCLGGTDAEDARGIYVTNDGGFVVTGKTLSNNGDVTGNHGVTDFWVVKLNGLGAIQWQKTLGGSNHDRGYSIQQTSDGGYIVAGHTESNNGDVSGFHGDIDFWVVKLNGLGVLQWQKTLGGSGWDEAWSVRQTTDGGYIVAGRTTSNDGDVTGNHGAFDFWIVKLDEIGNLQWQKTLGGSMVDIGYAVRQTIDGGYIVTGESDSNDGDASGLNGSGDFWVVKLNAVGTLEWQKMLGSTSHDRPNDIYPTNDGGYIVVGIASWNDGDVTGNHGGFDIWAVKLNAIGEIEWQKSLGGSKEDYAQSVQQTTDGGFIIAGSTSSLDGDVLGNDGGVDFWIVKLTPDGELQWQKTVGGTQADRALSIHQSSDGGYIVAGYTQSNNSGDVSGFHGVQDYWVVKFSPESVGTKDFLSQSSNLEIYPNPASHNITLRLASEEPTITVTITDLLGRQLSRQTIPNGGSPDISALPNGLYLVTATTPSGKVFAGKFRKQ
ncbi:MAG: T9SS type A sorting domain-containing protein [Saprospiraceae bacterium]